MPIFCDKIKDGKMMLNNSNISENESACWLAHFRKN